MAKFMLFMYFGINLVAYVAMWRDKRAAIKNEQRTPERTFHWISAFFGAFGIWLASRSPLFHKRAKKTFMRWTYLFLVINLLLILLMTIRLPLF